MIPVGASAERAAARDWRTLHELWNPSPGPPGIHPPAVRLFCEGGRLVFQVQAPGPSLDDACYAPPGPGGDLWRSDCGEFFLAAPQSGRYIEVNVGPRGAWWAGLFQAPRIRCAERPVPADRLEVSCSAGRTGAGWRGEWSASMSGLTGWLGAGPGAVLTANATCVVGSGDGRRFFSRCVLPPGGSPDFHQPACWPVFDPENGLS